ncbi:MAG: hypothetical protein JXR45_15005 [Deltaproteobacteria bacterium]|nr:hypothetical protein [Deltaproteobacteria bacterium]
MNTTVRAQPWNQTVSRPRCLVFTLFVFLLAPVGTAYAQGTTDDTGPDHPTSDSFAAPALEMPPPQQSQSEGHTLPLPKKQKPYRLLGASLSIVGTISIITGGGLVLLAASNDNQVKDDREQWMTTTDPIELEQLKQDIRDTENKRDLQNAFGIGTLLMGIGSLITGLILLSIESEAPIVPDSSRQAKSPLRFRPLIGAADVALQVTF